MELNHETAVAFACHFEQHERGVGGFLGAIGVLDGASEGGIAGSVELVDRSAKIAKAGDGEEVVNGSTDEMGRVDTGHSGDAGIGFGNSSELVVADEAIGGIAKGSR